MVCIQIDVIAQAEWTIEVGLADPPLLSFELTARNWLCRTHRSRLTTQIRDLLEMTGLEPIVC